MNEARKMAQLVKYLLCLHEDLSSDPQHLYKKLEVAANTCNRGEVKVDRRIRWLSSQSGELNWWAPGLLQDCLEKSNGKWLGNISDVNLWLPRAPTHTCVCRHIRNEWKCNESLHRWSSHQPTKPEGPCMHCRPAPPIMNTAWACFMPDALYSLHAKLHLLVLHHQVTDVLDG